MFTDMVGSTASAQANEADALQLRDEQEGLVRPLFAAHQGRVVKSMGDGFLVEFESALRAVQCAVDIQQHLEERNAPLGVTPIRLRIGIHLGDVEQRGTDIFGDAVNIASRIEPLASPGGLCISGPVYDQVRNKIPNRLEKLEARTLKGLRVPIDTYRVVMPWTAAELPTASSGPTRLAVLPFTNISPDPKDEYFADGLTEELISVLSQIRGLRVIARTSVGQYKSTAKPIAQIGSELGVSSVLEGSVRKADGQLRITVQLIDVETEEHRWAQTYDRKLENVFAIQTEIAEKTAGALRLEMLGSERESLGKKPTSNLEAYNLYLRGIHSVRELRPHGATLAIRYFEEAIQADRDFSLAYAHLANLLLLLGGDSIAPGDAFSRAKVLVAKALELDPDSSDAHAALGNLALQCDQDWEISEIEFKRAISLNPSNAAAHFWYAILLNAVNRFDEAAQQLHATIELDPLMELAKSWLLIVHVNSGDLKSVAAIAHAQAGEESLKDRSHLALAQLYARAGRTEDARKEVQLAASPGEGFLASGRAILRAILGDPEEARRILSELEEARTTRYVALYNLALFHAALGETEMALELLERESREEYGGLWYVYQSVAFDSLRDDPRFHSLLKRQNLPINAVLRRRAG